MTAHWNLFHLTFQLASDFRGFAYVDELKIQGLVITTEKAMCFP